MNVVCLTGRLGQNADLRYTPGGTAVTNIELAVDRFGKDKDGEKLGALWIFGVVWGKQAEAVAAYLTKGKQVAITGELLPIQEYSTQSGEKRTQLRVNVRHITLLGGGEKQEKAPKQDAADEDIPF